jgi:hypothetical protein
VRPSPAFLLAAVVGFTVAPGPSGDVAPAPFHATLKAYTHAPKVTAHWPYEVHVTDAAGHPLRARLTVQIVDPFGGIHPVEFDCCKRNIVDHPFRGVFRDRVEYPPEARGFKVTFRAIVKVGARKVLLNYWVKPR